MITYYQEGDHSRRLNLMIDNMQDLSQVLRRFGKHLRERAADRFSSQGPGWPQLAESTVVRLQSTRVANVTAAGKVRKSYARKLGQYLRMQVKAGKVDEAALKQLRYLVKGGSAAVNFQSQVEERLKSRAVERLRQQLLKAEERSDWERTGGKREIERRSLLGKLANSLRAKVDKGVLIVESQVSWAGVHNEGGVANRGAQIPARPFLYLTPADMDVLQAMAVEYMAAVDVTDVFGGR